MVKKNVLTFRKTSALFLTIRDNRKTDVKPWDKLKDVQPPLRALLQSKQQDWPRQGRALVPGCGRVSSTRKCILQVLCLRTGNLIGI